MYAIVITVISLVILSACSRNELSTSMDPQKASTFFSSGIYSDTTHVAIPGKDTGTNVILTGSQHTTIVTTLSDGATVTMTTNGPVFVPMNLSGNTR